MECGRASPVHWLPRKGKPPRSGVRRKPSNCGLPADGRCHRFHRIELDQGLCSSNRPWCQPSRRRWMRQRRRRARRMHPLRRSSDWKRERIRGDNVTLNRADIERVIGVVYSAHRPVLSSSASGASGFCAVGLAPENVPGRGGNGNIIALQTEEWLKPKKWPNS